MKALKIFLCTLTLLFGVAGMSDAYTWIDDKWNPSDPSDEMNLYEIFNDIFGGNYYSTSDDLFNDRGLADSADDWWYETNGHITVTGRYAGYDPELGIEDNDGYYVKPECREDGKYDCDDANNPAKETLADLLKDKR